jgi:hypothetical protein
MSHLSADRGRRSHVEDDGTLQNKEDMGGVAKWRRKGERGHAGCSPAIDGSVRQPSVVAVVSVDE